MGVKVCVQVEEGVGLKVDVIVGVGVLVGVGVKVGVPKFPLKTQADPFHLYSFWVSVSIRTSPVSNIVGVMAAFCAAVPTMALEGDWRLEGLLV